MSKTIDIDGSLGEGGGQVLRTSLALSLITGKAFHLRKVRAGRAKPGLQAQHLMSVQAAAKIGAAHTRGAHLGSGDLVFEPGSVTPGDYHFKIGTAGATGLVLHTIYLPLALARVESNITIEGGTHVKAAPCYHFLAHTWAAYLAALGLPIALQFERAGFYPRGGGMIRAHIQPAALRPFHGMEATAVTQATIVCGVAGLPPHIARRMIDKTVFRLRDIGMKTDAISETWPGGPGCMLGVLLPTAPAPTFLFSLGEKGKPAETVADEAADQVIAFLDEQPLGVDVHSADQLLLPLALAEGMSEFRVSEISSHLLTNAAVVRQFLACVIEIDGSEGEPGSVRISSEPRAE